MRLEQYGNGKRRGDRSAEVLRPPEQIREMSFDIHSEVPDQVWNEVEWMLRLPNPVRDASDRKSLILLAGLDPLLAERMRANPQIEVELGYMAGALGDSMKPDLLEVCNMTDYAFDFNIAHLAHDGLKRHLDTLLEESTHRTDYSYDANTGVYKLRALLQTFPEYHTKIKQHVEEKKVWDVAWMEARTLMKPGNLMHMPHFALNLMLVFPEHADQIRNLVKQLWNDMKQEVQLYWDIWVKDQEHNADYGRYLRPYILNIRALALLAADEVELTSDGRIRVTEHPVDTQPSLPPRLTAA